MKAVGSEVLTVGRLKMEDRPVVLSFSPPWCEKLGEFEIAVTDLGEYCFFLGIFSRGTQSVGVIYANCLTRNVSHLRCTCVEQSWVDGREKANIDIHMKRSVVSIAYPKLPNGRPSVRRHMDTKNIETN